jgi:hypothetical protein
MLRAARIGCEISAVTITGGDRAHSITGGGGEAWSVPKQDLIAEVQVLLERDELRIAKRIRDAGPLVRELLDMRVSQGRGGRVRVGADGYGEHDDLVIALALACWRAKRKQFGFGVRRLPGT